MCDILDFKSTPWLISHFDSKNLLHSPFLPWIMLNRVSPKCFYFYGSLLVVIPHVLYKAYVQCELDWVWLRVRLINKLCCPITRASFTIPVALEPLFQVLFHSINCYLHKNETYRHISHEHTVWGKNRTSLWEVENLLYFHLSCWCFFNCFDTLSNPNVYIALKHSMTYGDIIIIHCVSVSYFEKWIQQGCMIVFSAEFCHL